MKQRILLTGVTGKIMNHKPKILAIAGPSCGGKTRLAKEISQYFKHLEPGLLRLDSYYRVFNHLSIEERSKINFDEPAAVDWELLTQHLKILKQGGSVFQPVYDYTTHTRTQKQDPLNPGSLLIVEGLFSLHPRLAKYSDHKIFVQLEMAKCLDRRIKRDVRERKRSEQSIRHQFTSQVKPMFDLHIAETIDQADLVISGEASLTESLKKMKDLLDK